MMKFNAIKKLYPSVTMMRGEDALDDAGNSVAYDEQAVQAKMLELQQDEEQARQDAEAHKASAIAKLTALGLTADEIKALTGVQA